MDNILDVAGYMTKRYKEVTGEPVDEMKLQKMLYFMQRDSFAIEGEPAFEGDFEGWRFGPVSRDVRNVFKDGKINIPTKDISRRTKYIADNCIQEYGALASWRLSDITHREISWLNARQELAPNENGERVIALEDIKEDSRHVRPFDHVWDMYYDEFEDVDA